MFKKWAVGIVMAAVVSLGGMSAVQADHPVGTVNCGDFNSGDEVYEFWTSHNYSAENDPEGLDRESDGRPCESLTEGMESQFLGYQSEQVTEEAPTENESTEETVGAEDSSEDEGDALPVTATSYPTIMLLGLLTAGAGALVLFRRKTTQA